MYLIDHYDKTMCYSILIGHINHAVEDMKRFHFEACSVKQDEMKKNCTLKRTQQTGMEFLQSDLISST